jgi:hypothetical protein
VLLPYASYLRVYEPAEQSAVTVPGVATGDAPVEAAATVTLAREQQTVLRKTVASAPGTQADLTGCYLLRRDDRLYVCGVDLALRSWLALATFVEDTDSTTRALFLLSGHAERAEMQFTSWRMANPATVPHIRSATWGVPRTWFLVVAEDEREGYEVGGAPSVRFRTPLAVARGRLEAAQALVSAMIDDDELIEELDDLEGWLASFAADSWLELDYAGVGHLLGAALDSDRSAAEIATAMSALERKDFAAAGESYRSFVDRWRVVNALERAN